MELSHCFNYLLRNNYCLSVYSINCFYETLFTSLNMVHNPCSKSGTGRVSYLIHVSLRHHVLTTSGDIVMFLYGSVFELLIC